jgi:hypothetical protein
VAGEGDFMKLPIKFFVIGGAALISLTLALLLFGYLARPPQQLKASAPTPPPPSPGADFLDTQERALSIIADFADQVCKSLPLQGSGGNLELSGRTREELSELTKKLAGLGIEGASKYNTSGYQEILQKDLKAMLQESSSCSLVIFRDFTNKPLQPLV